MEQVIFEMRLPRVLAACFTGSAFALSGALMQGITYNPLADSGLLGINAGAGFMVVLGAVFLPSVSALSNMLLAFTGGALAVLMVYGLGMRKRKKSAVHLILAGSAVSSFLIALSQGISLTFGLSKELTFWSTGSLAGITWIQIGITFPCLIIAIFAAVFISSKLSVLALGEESAAGLGLNVTIVRITAIIIVLVMAGVSVSLVGGISFIGLIIPHISKRLVGADYRRVLPVCAILGALLLVVADVVARTIHAPFDTPVGAVVSIIGVPFLLGITYQKKGVRL